MDKRLYECIRCRAQLTVLGRPNDCAYCGGRMLAVTPEWQADFQKMMEELERIQSENS